MDPITAVVSMESNACFPGQVQYLKPCNKTYRAYSAANSLVIWGHCASEPNLVKSQQPKPIDMEPYFRILLKTNSGSKLCKR